MGYLSLSQVLGKLKSIPEQYQPQTLVQLAEACINEKIIPVFLYSLYALECVCGTGENTKYIIIPVRGYLTNESLVNVFNWTSSIEKKVEFTEAKIYELTQQEEFLYKGKSIVLAKTTFHHLRPIGNAKSLPIGVAITSNTKLYSSSNEKDAERIRDFGGVEISQNDLLFPTEQVEDYIESFICENEDNALDSFIFDSSSTNAEIELQKKEIDLLKADISQLIADNNDLQSRLEQQADKPANNYQQLSERSEKSYQTTIGLLIELMVTPKGVDDKQPFPSQAVIISEIADKGIYGQGTSTLETRFGNANDVVADAKKK